MDKSPTDTNPMRLLEVGERVSPTTSEYTYTVLACWLAQPSDVDTYARWVVLCHLPHNDFHPFAVWLAYDRPDGWYFSNGEYYKNLADAMDNYENRGADPRARA